MRASVQAAGFTVSPLLPRYTGERTLSLACLLLTLHEDRGLWRRLLPWSAWRQLPAGTREAQLHVLFPLPLFPPHPGGGTSQECLVTLVMKIDLGGWLSQVRPAAWLQRAIG